MDKYQVRLYPKKMRYIKELRRKFRRSSFLFVFVFLPYSNIRMGTSAGMPSLVGKPFQRLAPLVTKTAVPSSL